MSKPITVVPRFEINSFMGFPLCMEIDTLEADMAVLGIPYGDPYNMDEVTNDQSNAPTAVRRESARLSSGLAHWDFDLAGPLFDGRDIRVVDCGDVPAEPADMKGHYRNAETAVRKILERGAYPIIIGGDHGVPIPVLRAFEDHGPLTLVHVDAHLDWRDEVNGVREGYSSPIRRASELSHTESIFQIGMRAQGSARTMEVEDALAYGAEIITAYEVHDKGISSVLERIPGDKRYYLTIDADGLDPSVMPAVAGPAPGGLLYHQVRTLIHGLVGKGRLAGMDIVEITPGRDVNGISSLTAGQLIVNYIGMAARAGYFES
jgi:agmatinase